jgi:mRNA-degrading endonuclease YafQ of YafQ-DinJ toxin-antitoxin module
VEVSFASSFGKSFRKTIASHPEIELTFWQKLEIFIANPFDSTLRTHKLSGQLKNYWSFSVGYEYRIVFYFTSDKPKKAVLVDIGTHDEVY